MPSPSLPAVAASAAAAAGRPSVLSLLTAPPWSQSLWGHPSSSIIRPLIRSHHNPCYVHLAYMVTKTEIDTSKLNDVSSPCRESERFGAEYSVIQNRGSCLDCAAWGQEKKIQEMFALLIMQDACTFNEEWKSARRRY
ncbi:hypothetical protein EJB05_09868 [Eragrostis curvula]|uniref:Uncharacterized protein n=1 Tax=Eragrostis curvula TaxID=38414 RepID=A0A5J9W7Q2_9POAL|nr:hypothetical protein EJB05_09868 [Eragrostis curvula]